MVRERVRKALPDSVLQSRSAHSISKWNPPEIECRSNQTRFALRVELAMPPLDGVHRIRVVLCTRTRSINAVVQNQVGALTGNVKQLDGFGVADCACREAQRYFVRLGRRPPLGLAFGIVACTKSSQNREYANDIVHSSTHQWEPGWTHQTMPQRHCRLAAVAVACAGLSRQQKRTRLKSRQEKAQRCSVCAHHQKQKVPSIHVRGNRLVRPRTTG